MFSKSHRFHGYGSLKGVYQRGQGVRGGMISLKYLKRDSAKPYRVAVVVSKKVNKSAVKRNRIRRRIYEQVRQSDIAIEPGTDLVFTVFSDQIADTEAAKLQKAVDELLQKAK